MPCKRKNFFLFLVVTDNNLNERFEDTFSLRKNLCKSRTDRLLKIRNLHRGNLGTAAIKQVRGFDVEESKILVSVSFGSVRRFFGGISRSEDRLIITA